MHSHCYQPPRSVRGRGYASPLPPPPNQLSTSTPSHHHFFTPALPRLPRPPPSRPGLGYQQWPATSIFNFCISTINIAICCINLQFNKSYIQIIISLLLSCHLSLRNISDLELLKGFEPAHPIIIFLQTKKIISLAIISFSDILCFTLI